MRKKIEKTLAALPASPGVYHFFNAKKERIYVGKASNLKNRVRSYFQQGATLSDWKQKMITEIATIEIHETDSEIEALLLEANHIKKYQPKYNVLFRDDKSYQYIKVSTEETWPRVFSTRQIDKAGTYFGPFTSGYAVKEILRVLRKIVPYRCNQKPINPDDLRSPVLRSQTTEDGAPKFRSPKFPKACLQFHLGLCPGTCIGAIGQKEYARNIKIILLFLAGKKRDVIRSVKQLLGPERAQFVENLLAHTRILAVAEKYANDVRELQRSLALPRPPTRIEGYDVANLMGKEATGAMVVFMNGEPEKGEYKKFKIKTVPGANDVAMLTEVLERRLNHDDWNAPDLLIIDGGKAQLNAAVRALKRAEFDVPVLSVAKGGHGGVLKQKEELYFPGEKTPLKLPKTSPALHLILRVRDEAHRFAIGYHKTLRTKKFIGTRDPQSAS